MRAGDTLGSYVIVRELGAGGMGTVYLAEHSALGRRAAIKVLQPELTSNQQMLTRFFNEARAASAIKSPGIVEIYDFGRHGDGSAYIVMELLEGEPLAARLARLGKLPLGNALVIARQIASALAPAHRAGIIHRDLKPDNVFLVPDAEVAGGERVKLLDFGIAKLLGDDERGGKLTSTKTVMGTPHYMSPEQCRGAGGVDARSDLYALGCMLYELLTGQPPFTGEGAGDLIAAHIYLPPRKLTELSPELPADVDQLVERLLSKAAAQRPQSAEEVTAALTALTSRFSATWASPTIVPPASASMVANPPPPDYPRLDPGTPMAGVSRAPQRAAAQKKDRRVTLAVASGLLLLAVVGVYAAARGGGEAQQLAQSPLVTASDATTEKAASDAAQAGAVIDAASPVADPSAGSGASVGSDAAPATAAPMAAELASRAAKRAECAQLQRDERWADLKKCASELRAAKDATPDDLAAAAELTQQSKLEVTAKAQYDKFLAAQKADDLRGMATVARGFNESSRYAQQVQETWEAEKGKYVAIKVARARAAAKDGRCGELRNLSASVRLYDARAADEIADLSCTAATAAPAVDCKDPVVLGESSKLFEDIQAARISNPKVTIRLVEAALANRCLAPKKNILARIGVVAACSEKRVDKAFYFFAKTKDPSLVQACPEYLGDVIK